jgi:hypothetical protein
MKTDYQEQFMCLWSAALPFAENEERASTRIHAEVGDGGRETASRAFRGFAEHDPAASAQGRCRFIFGFRAPLHTALFLLIMSFIPCLVSRAAGVWSLEAVTDPVLPSVQRRDWAKDPLDLFILAKLEAASLAPNPDADRQQLLRRVYFDLIGLPPTPEAIAAFTNDRAPLDAAFAKVVKRLLDSPAFGERWARHWLDIARYADTDGSGRVHPYTMAWRYRQWVIDAFNGDKPYDFFVAEQLAGDLFPRPTEDTVAATGFLALGAHDLSMIGRRDFELDRIHEQIDTTSRAFLGLTVGCARCHDHKYDPITQADYYALAGIFQSSKTWFSTQDPSSIMMKSGGTKSASPSGAETREGIPSALWTTSNFRSGGIRSEAKVREVQVTPKSNGMVMGNGDRIFFSRAAALTQTALSTSPATGVLQGLMGVSEFTPSDCAIRIRGEHRQLGSVVPRGRVQIPGLPPFPAIPESESGRRQLALWIASPENPLTARVAVNRIWGHLFGRALVSSAADFGFMGDKPTHPELLDHLATRFVREGWSMKRLIQAVVLSRAYRMSSQSNEGGRNADPQNQLLWRMNWKRMEVEPLRDAFLQIGDILKPERPAGSPIETGTSRPLLGLSSPFRSIYLPVTRNGNVPKMFDSFDFPDSSQVSVRRDSSTNSAQALFLLNSTLMDQVSANVERKIMRASPSERISFAYLLTLGRSPSPLEAREAGIWIELEKRNSSKPAWQLFAQVLLASPEFRYVR